MKPLQTLVRTYISLLKIHFADPWRVKNQSVYADLRDAIAEITGTSSEEVQDYYEQIAKNEP